jgi:oligopeptidase B
MTNTKNKIVSPKIPSALKKNKLLEIHGDKRSDDYYWMNDYWLKGTDSGRVLNYLDEENAYFNEVMKPTLALQDTLYKEIIGRISREDQSVPFFKNGYWYITKTNKGEEYPVHLRRKGSLKAADELLIDVNKLAKGSAYCSVASLEVSPDNTMLAFSVDTVSRRNYSVYFKNLDTGILLEDIIPFSSGNIVWAADNKTVYYINKNRVTLRSESAGRHVLGTPVSCDEIVFLETDEAFSVSVAKTKSCKYILIQSCSTLSKELRYLDAADESGFFKVFLPRQANHLYDIEHHENRFYILTNWKALNFRLMECPIHATAIKNWREIIPNHPHVLLDGIEVFKDYLVLSERNNASTQIKIIAHACMQAKYIKFRDVTYLATVGYNPEYYSNKLRYSYESMRTPRRTYEYDMRDARQKILKQQQVVGGYKPNDYVTEKLWAVGKDGTKIPVSIVYKKGFKKNGKHPLLLYGYGSYGLSMDAAFSISAISLLNRGFAYAIAHIRGGQEMGRQWYEDGKMFSKKNTFTDYIDCAEFLIANKYTSSKHFYASGASAGGLLMGAIVNMRPELFNGIITEMPFVDIVTTMLDESIPLTTAEFNEWGNPRNKASYDYMKSYSPYDNLAKKDYPNMLVLTGLHDSQVQYFEPSKYVARLRELKTDDHVLIMYCNMLSGHGGASGSFQQVKEDARDYAFLLMLENKK